MTAPAHRKRAASLHTLFARTGITGAFSSKVSDYAASRPDYPPAVLDALQTHGLVFPGARVADIAAGTGLFTRALLERGHRVLAVEPNTPMREIALATLHNYPLFTSIQGSAEATTLDDASIDLVTAAQAFHWFNVAKCRREFLRILKPAGRVALIWNTRPLEDPLQGGIDAILSIFGGAKHVELAHQQDLRRVPRFFTKSSFHQSTFPHAQELNHDGLLSLVLSRSSMPDRGTVDGSHAEQAVSRTFERFAHAGRVTVNYRTVVMIGRPHA